MLNIPEEVKTLFRQGSVRKNLRIHFPNGERADITNENLLSESFSFTESICSQDTLRFGLCEASMVKFETFDVENIKGFTIEVSIEILNGKEYFAIPIGTFIVDSCKRKETPKRRSVVAYGFMADFNTLSDVEVFKRHGIANNKSTYEFDVFKNSISNLKSVDSDLFEMEEVTLSDTTAGYQGGLPYGYWFSFRTEIKMYEIYDLSDLNRLYYFKNQYKANMGTFQSTLSDIVDEFESRYNINYTTDKKLFLEQCLIEASPSVSWPVNLGTATIVDGSNYIYPYVKHSNTSNGTLYARIALPYSSSVVVLTNNEFGGSQIIESEEIAILEDSPRLFVVDDSNFPHYTYSKANYSGQKIDYLAMWEGYIETLGKFGRYNRHGNFEFVDISNNFAMYPSEDLYPSETLYPIDASGGILETSRYKKVLYDDEYIKPYGRVEVKYKNENNEDSYAYFDILDLEKVSSDQYQVYSLSDNYMIQNVQFTSDEIQVILNTISDKIKNIQYMPSEIDLIGLPYIEAGDALQVLTRDGGFETFVFERTLNGIQSLSDSFVAN